MRAPERLKSVAGYGRGDLAIALALSAFLLIALAAAGLLHGRGNLLEAGTGVGVFCCLIPRRAHPQLAADAAAVFFALSALGPEDVIPNGLGNLVAVPVFLLAYSLGTEADQRRSVPPLLLLLAGLQVGNGVTTFNPIFLVLTIGPWALGLVVRSRRRLTEQLIDRGIELEAERALFAAEAVRYERARIARELHDIVAHCVSVMVIQASAGQRLTATDPSLAAEAFDSIGEVAQQAEAEIGRLLELLDATGQPRGADGLRLIGELVTRASAAGLAVSCRFSGPADGLPLTPPTPPTAWSRRASPTRSSTRRVRRSTSSSRGPEGRSRSGCATGPRSARHPASRDPAVAGGWPECGSGYRPAAASSPPARPKAAAGRYSPGCRASPGASQTSLTAARARDLRPGARPRRPSNPLSRRPRRCPPRRCARRSRR